MPSLALIVLLPNEAGYRGSTIFAVSPRLVCYQEGSGRKVRYMQIVRNPDLAKMSDEVPRGRSGECATVC